MIHREVAWRTDAPQLNRSVTQVRDDADDVYPVPRPNQLVQHCPNITPDVLMAPPRTLKGSFWLSGAGEVLEFNGRLDDANQICRTNAFDGSRRGATVDARCCLGVGGTPTMFHWARNGLFLDERGVQGAEVEGGYHCAVALASIGGEERLRER